eukprot:8403739-Ditylum_brightwellii.AAC.1
MQSLVIEFWEIFREDGVTTPVHNYELVIDTGDHQPIAVKKPHYGIHEVQVMEKSIKGLIDKGHITKNVTSPWAVCITFLPKPHQEEVKNIE